MTDTITITINSEHDRSSKTVDRQFSRRLRALADHLEKPAFADSYGDNIVDIDGKKIGEWQITPADGAGEEVTPETIEDRMRVECELPPADDVPTVLRRMFSETIKLGESWEADGNRMMSDFEHGKFITESLDEWAYNFSALADEYESLKKAPLHAPLTSAEQTHRLAKEFARLMTEALHPDVFSLVNALNGGRKYEATSCASHEFLDANEVMLEAMSNLGIEFAPENEENATLTNDAWQIAKVMNFTL